MSTEENKTAVKVAVIGQGYVGLPFAMRAVEVGYRVFGYDLDTDRVGRLRSGDSFVEDVDSKVLAEALAGGTYTVSDDEADLEGFDVAVITVPTPLRDSIPDLGYIESAAEVLSKYVRPGCLVILESTTYPGTTEELLVPALEKGSGLSAGPDFMVGYSPERIDPGNRVWTFATTPKVVSGIDQQSMEAVAEFYSTLVKQVVRTKGVKEAELTKLLENTFRHVNVALVNELAIFSHQLGIDIWDAIDAATTKPFGYMRFTPGPGVGGHCLPIDPSYLSWRVRQSLGEQFRFVELANDVNEHMPNHVARRTMEILNDQSKSIRGSRIVCLGLAYKKNSSDARESPALHVAAKLLALGATVVACDTYVSSVPKFHGRGMEGLAGLELVPFNREEMQKADIVVVLTDHDNVDYEVVLEAKAVFDTRHRCRNAENVQYL